MNRNFKYNNILRDCIKAEKKGEDYYYTQKDKVILCKLLKEVNSLYGTHFKYLAELDMFDIKGAGEIIARYIMEFTSESVKAYLIPQMVSDRIPNCDRMVLQLYLNFKNSNEYIPSPGTSLPAHILVSYDNAFKDLKPKRLSNELLELSYCIRDVFYLPLTMRMLASWKIAEFREQLLYILSESSTAIPTDFPTETNIPLFMKRELIFTVLEGLQYYPSEETLNCIKPFVADSDPDVRAIAQKTTAKIKNNTGK